MVKTERSWRYLWTRLSLCVIGSLWNLGPAAAQSPVLSNEHFELVLHPDAKIVSRHDNGWETNMVVEQDGLRVRINWSDSRALLLFPTSTLRVQNEETRDGKILTAYLDSQKYKITQTKREIGWILPGQEVFFRTRGGNISQAVGTADYLKMRRDTPSGRVTLESAAGTTDALLKKGVLETFDGPEFTEHIYLVRGLAFRAGPVTLRIPLPAGPFLKGLPADRYFTIAPTIEPLPEPAAQNKPLKEKDPLQAEPATWSSPELKARIVGPDEDPLNAKRENIVKHPEDPLKAKTSRDSEELLRVKDY
jgi:hypothetical protein